jgi:hypothetical protein
VVSQVSIMIYTPCLTPCVYSLEPVFWQKSPAGTRKQMAKLGLVWRNRNKSGQIINDYLCLSFFLLIILWSRVSAGVIHCVFHQIPNLSNCFTPSNRNLGGDGPQTDKHLAPNQFLRKSLGVRALGL